MGKGMLEPGKRSWLAFFISVAVVVGLAAIGLRYFLEHRDDPPVPGQTDVDEQGVAARVQWVKGKVVTRPAHLEEYSFREPTGIVENPREVEGKDAPLYAGSWIGLEAGSSMQLKTNGNFIMILDGPGEYLFEDARRQDDNEVSKSKHVLLFRMKRGMLRAKRHDYDPSQHWLQVIVPKGRIILEQGEIGVETHRPGSGRFWVVSGKVTYRPNEGQRRADLPRGIHHL